jgi:hypothetical protein
VSIDAETNSGQRLLCRSEFHGQSDHHTVLTIARRKDDEGVQNMEGSSASPAVQSVLIYGEYNFHSYVVSMHLTFLHGVQLPLTARLRQ